jgi:hypothetical protein
VKAKKTPRGPRPSRRERERILASAVVARAANQKILETMHAEADRLNRCGDALLCEIADAWVERRWVGLSAMLEKLEQQTRVSALRRVRP